MKKKFLYLRKKHSHLIYESFQVKRDNKKIYLNFKILLTPDIVFTPKIIIPFSNPNLKNSDQLNNLAFHLGMMKVIRYWKTACPQKIVIKAGSLSLKQIFWWKNLLIRGLGEFFYTNNINFTSKDFLEITNQKTAPSFIPLKTGKLEGDLILTSGGKDSCVTLELLKRFPSKKTCLAVNPTPASFDIIRLARYQNLLIIKDILDPKLKELNKKGYFLKGHAPFSAELAFLGTFVATLYNLKNLVVSNEHSADEENLIFKGYKINHQYSKSFEFEKSFRSYCRRYLHSKIQYFSFPRPLYELQISRIFSSFSQYHSAFRSCNHRKKRVNWCGRCPKCAFIYLSLFPFLTLEKIKKIFGENYFGKPEIIPFIRQLVGLETHKPFECVGTIKESVLAIALTLARYKKENKRIPPVLSSLEKKLNLTPKRVKNLERGILNHWNPHHFLPPLYREFLKKEYFK